MKNKWIKGIGLVLVGFASLVVIAVLALLGTGRSRFVQTYDITPPPLDIPTDEKTVARGEHLVTAVAHCGYCHGPQLAGEYVVNKPGAEGVFVAPNLTSGEGGLGAEYTSEDWISAIRHGVVPEGRSVMIMPSNFFNVLSGEDLAAMIAYLQSIPAVDNVLPETSPGPLFYALLGTGALRESQSAYNIEHKAPYTETPAEGSTVEYGAYLARIGQCATCHGAQLAGGQVEPSAPIGPNLTPGGELGQWSAADFITLIRTGVEPSGRQIDPYMPWAYFSQMSDTELNALWAYLQTQPALADQMTAQE